MPIRPQVTGMDKMQEFSLPEAGTKANAIGAVTIAAGSKMESGHGCRSQRRGFVK